MSKALLLVFVSTFIVLIGGGIRKRAQMAVAPPTNDPISYYGKAQFVWTALAKGDLRGILNGPISVRGPGAALVMYPFGFRTSIHSFLFRSVFAPILIWLIALFIPIAARVPGRRDALLGSALIVGLTAMPVFYHFEINKTFLNTYNIGAEWGLVDTLAGAVGALAVSLLCVSIANGSKIGCTIGWLVGAFSLFIKPVGLLLMMVLIGIATVEFVILFLGSDSSRRAILKFMAFVYFIGFCIFGFTLWLVFGSDYMSSEVIAQSVRAQQFYISLYQAGELFPSLALFIVPVIGWWWFCPGAIFSGFVVAEAVQSIARRQSSSLALRLATAGMILVSAVCWWIFLAGQQHRYLFPFLLMVIAWFIPEIFQRVLQFGPSAKGAVIGYCLTPAILLGGLLWSKDPPMIWQQLLGVNLSAGGHESEVKQGRWLLAESSKLGRPLNLYLVGGYDAGVVETIGWGNSLENKNAPPRFIVRRPNDWMATPGLYAEDLTRSEFFLLEDIQPEGPGKTTDVLSTADEIERFKQFAYSKQGVDQNGLELISDGPVKLLQVADRRRFSEAFYTWANSIQWKNDFRERNKAFFEKLPK
jgi:hypothetical protein